MVGDLASARGWSRYARCGVRFAIDAPGRRAAASDLQIERYLTLVAVHVSDKDGRPISGLCDAPFRLFANNRERPIGRCEFVSAHPPVVAAKNRPDSDVRDNRHAGPFGRRFVVVVDDLHLIEQDAFSIKRIANHFVDGLSSSDEVAVAFVGRSDLGQDFTNSRERLLSRAERSDRRSDWPGPAHHTQHWCELWYIRRMDAARKITVEIPEDLLEKAQRASGTGVTQTVRAGLQLLAASQAYSQLRQLRGKVKFSRTLAEIKADR
jgi:hypothetical protein